MRIIKCPKCQGRMFLEQTLHFWVLACINCSHTIDVKRIVNKVVRLNETPTLYKEKS